MPGDNTPGKPHKKPDNNRRHGTNTGGPQKPRRTDNSGPKNNTAGKPGRDNRNPNQRDRRTNPSGPERRDRGPRRDDRNSHRSDNTPHRDNRGDNRSADKRQHRDNAGQGAPSGRPDKRGERPDDRRTQNRHGDQNRQGSGPPKKDGPGDRRGPDRGDKGAHSKRDDRPGQERSRRAPARSRPDEDRRPKGQNREDDQNRRGSGPPKKHGPGDRRGPDRKGARPNRPNRDDRTRQERPQRDPEPELPEGAVADELHNDVRRELRSMPRNLADNVAAHLVAAGHLMETDPEKALEHARFARKRASRVGAVREANGLTAYYNGQWSEALSELRAARRMTGDAAYLPVMADCERALGRPQRAIELSRDPESPQLERAEAVELSIVTAGARRDLGQVEASVVALQLPELESQEQNPWNARLFYAYADNLLAADRVQEAFTWFVHAADADDEGETDAPDRLDELFVQLGGEDAIGELVTEPGTADAEDREEVEEEATDAVAADEGTDAAEVNHLDNAETNGDSTESAADEPDGQ